jgi:hypothetical protein
MVASLPVGSEPAQRPVDRHSDLRVLRRTIKKNSVPAQTFAVYDMLNAWIWVNDQ